MKTLSTQQVKEHLNTKVSRSEPIEAFPSGTKVIWKRTLELWAYTALKSPLMFFIRPLITLLDDQTTCIRVKLNRRNKNPFNSMYFGALSSGAEMLPGIAAVSMSRSLKIPLSFLVKEFQGHYLSKADTDIIFVLKDNAAIKTAIIDSSKDGKSKDLSLEVKAYKEGSHELTACFHILMSFKSKQC